MLSVYSVFECYSLDVRKHVWQRFLKQACKDCFIIARSYNLDCESSTENMQTPSDNLGLEKAVTKSRVIGETSQETRVNGIAYFTFSVFVENSLQTKQTFHLYVQILLYVLLCCVIVLYLIATFHVPFPFYRQNNQGEKIFVYRWGNWCTSAFYTCM